jgi:endonuclease/exonuclease/phosphatase family metal-dependent hydrolase
MYQETCPVERIIRTLAAALVALLGFIPSVSAQTTVVIDTPDRVVDSFIRAGNYANRVYDTGGLVTKANKSASYVRRTLLRFDTHDTIPVNSVVQSATLTLTLNWSETDTRTLTAYRLTRAFDEAGSTWYRYKSTGESWTTAGGDLGASYAQASVGSAPGTRVTFDLTRLVQETVNGVHGSSRWTRVALVDGGATSPASYKEFYSSEAADPALRPQLRVVYGAPPPPPPPPATGGTLRVMHWNIHYGIGTDGAYGIDKHVAWIARLNPDIVSLNEVEKNVSGHGNEDQPALFAAKLTAITGQPWYYHHAQRYGNWGANGGGNLILSRFPIEARSQLAMSYNRSAALVTVSVNGRPINVISTHLASESSSYRDVQIRQLMTWARGFAEQRIIAGDFNAGLVNVPYMATEYADGWSAADAIGAAQCFPGNTRYGATHNYKIDFIFRSKLAQALTVQSARVFDIRDANGAMPSDHKPLLVVYGLQ